MQATTMQARAFASRHASDIAGVQAPRHQQQATKQAAFAHAPTPLCLHAHLSRLPPARSRTDVRKHPIMGYVEQVQVQHYLGSGWLFGSGNDVTAEDAEVAEALLAASNSTVAGPVVIQQ